MDYINSTRIPNIGWYWQPTLFLHFVCHVAKEAGASHHGLIQLHYCLLADVGYVCCVTKEAGASDHGLNSTTIPSIDWCRRPTLFLYFLCVLCDQGGWCITPWVFLRTKIKQYFQTCIAPWPFLGSTRFLHYICPLPMWCQIAKFAVAIWVV